MLGGGPLDGSPEPECDPAYDLVGIAEDQVEDQDARGEVLILMLGDSCAAGDADGAGDFLVMLVMLVISL